MPDRRRPEYRTPRRPERPGPWGTSRETERAFGYPGPRVGETDRLHEWLEDLEARILWLAEELEARR